MAVPVYALTSGYKQAKIHSPQRRKGAKVLKNVYTPYASPTLTIIHESSPPPHLSIEQRFEARFDH